MKKIKHLLLISLSLFLLSNNLNAQSDITNSGSYRCSQGKSKLKMSLDNNKSANSPKHNFDVLNYELNLDLYDCYADPYPHTFSGFNIVTFKIDTALNVINLDAVNSSLSIDSVALDGISFTHNSNVLTVNLSRTFNAGETANVKIYYHHLDVADGAFITGNGIVYTDSEPTRARFWYPCWDRPSDKATVDITAKVPKNVKLGSNGRLADSVQTADTIVYRWISRDPVATYLVVITSKVDYNLDIVYWQKGLNDSIPFRFYYNQGEDPSYIESVIPSMATYYSDIFGEHPFEKNGFATVDTQFVFGGMENQTLTTLCPNCWDELLVAHEFAHQWFGDMITCGTWGDLWLNEGFATYVEALWIEHRANYSYYKNQINADADYYLQNNPGWASANSSWNLQPPTIDTLFNYAVTYCKGAAILHQLRYVLGDTMFFNVIKSYATDINNFKLKNSVIPDFMAKVNEVTGQNYDWFFTEWLYNANHPVYKNTWTKSDLGSGNWSFSFNTKQIQTNAPFFKMPIEIRIVFSGGTDTVLTVMNDVNDQTFDFTFSKKPVVVKFDPNRQVVLKEASTSVGIDEKHPTNFNLKIGPNPFVNTVKCNYTLSVSSDISIVVFDILGNKVIQKEVKNEQSGNHSIELDTKELNSGVYFCSFKTPDQTETIKMLKISN